MSLQPRQATTTYRYLRVALAVLPAALATSVVWEIGRSSCVLGSISAYWYTPARGVFIGVLVAIGACLVVVKGDTDIEDVLLNLAGMVAPVIAFVPTAYDDSCPVPRPAAGSVRAGITNGVVALVVTALVVLVAAVIVGLRTRTARPTPTFQLGRWVGIAVFVVGLAAFLLARDLFDRTAHYAAAILFFGCVIAVAVIKSRTSTVTRRRGYAVVAGLMLLSLVLGLVLGLLAVEVALIVLFTAFWLLETREHWGEGVSG